MQWEAKPWRSAAELAASTEIAKPAFLGLKVLKPLLLDAERLARIRLTKNCAMLPASSVCGLYFAHPESGYFPLGKIGRDQVLEYASRKGVDLKTVERRLSSNLAYEVK